MQFCAMLKSKLGQVYFCYAFVLCECTPTDSFFLSFVNTIELEIESMFWGRTTFKLKMKTLLITFVTQTKKAHIYNSPKNP